MRQTGQYPAKARLLRGSLTDVYLLALAVAHDARLVTLDTRIPMGFVQGAKEDHLIAIQDQGLASALTHVPPRVEKLRANPRLSAAVGLTGPIPARG